MKANYIRKPNFLQIGFLCFKIRSEIGSKTITLKREFSHEIRFQNLVTAVGLWSHKYVDFIVQSQTVNSLEFESRSACKLS